MYLAAFGKHPGWNDHIDDLGLETPRLVDVKRRLYVEGIGSCIDAGAWERLEPAQQIDGFAHVFLWRKPGDIVLGRMWSSQDGKGRARYPMIVCAQVSGVPLEWALEHALPRLEELEAQCKSTGDAAAVRAALDSARTSLRGRLSRMPPAGPELKVSGRIWGELADCPAMGPDRVGLYRFLYQVERELGDYRPADGGSRSRIAAIAPHHVRVPACAGAPADELSLWTRAMLSQVTSGTELSIYVPLGRPWVDVVVGAPEGPQFMFLRASPKAVPLVTEIPYDLDPAFMARAAGLVAAGKDAPEREIAPGGAGAEVRPGLLSRLSEWARGRSGMILGLVGGGAALLAGLGLMARGWSGSPAPVERLPSIVTAREPASTPPGPEVWDQGPWRELVSIHRSWFGMFLRRLDEPPSTAPPGTSYATRRALYVTDPGLASLLKGLDAARAVGPIEPLALAGLTRGDLSSLERSPPDSVRSNPLSVQRALEQARAFRDALSSDWPVRAELQRAASMYESLGWKNAAGEIAVIVEGVTPKAGRDAAPSVDATLAAAALVRDIEAARASIQEAGFAATGDPVLSAFPAFALAMIGAAEGTPRLPAMREVSVRCSGLAARLRQFVSESWGNVDQEAFAGSRVRTAFAGTPTWETYDSWLFEVKDYPALDPALSPLGTWKAPVRLAEVESIRATMSAEFPDAGDAAEASRLASLRDRVATLSGTPWNRGTQSALVAGARQVDQEADALWEAARGRLERARAQRVGSAAEARDRLRSQERVVPSSPALSAAWAGWRDRLVADIPDDQYPRMLAAAQELQQVLDEFGRENPPGLADDEGTASWSGALAAAAGAKRESVVKSALDPLRDKVPAPEEVRKALEPAHVQRQAWLQQASALAADLRIVEARLRGAHGVDEAVGGTTLGEAAARAAGSPVLRDEAVLNAVRPLLSRVDAVRRASSGDAASRATLVIAPDTERAAAVAAWRSLGESSGWPSTPWDLALERDASRMIARIADTMDDRVRGDELRAALAGEMRARWARCAARQASAGDFELVAGAAQDFGVIPEKVDNPHLRTNLLLAQTKARCQGGLSDEQANAAAGVLAASLRGAQVTGDARMGPILDELDVFASGVEPPPPSIDITMLGPGAAGWKGVAEGDSVRFTRGDASLEFVRLEPPGGEPVYLATTETSVGVVVAVLPGIEPGSKFETMTGGVDKMRLRSWMVTKAGFSRSTLWTEFPAKTAQAYGQLAAEGPPTDASPMQRISAVGAVYVAHLLGCRLPTATEWKAALATGGGAGDLAEWNLRDSRWSQWQAAAAGINGAGLVALWPDGQVFWPAGFKSATVSGAKAAPVHAGDDGFRLPAPVASDSTHRFHHILGNAAEFLLDPPLDGSQVQWGDPESVTQAVLARADSIRVIGGSALSAPDIDRETPHAPDTFETELKTGYSDVGFRVVFDARGAAAPRLPVAVRIVKLIDKFGYLSPE